MQSTPPDSDPSPDMSPGEDGVMAFWDHVEELRWVILKTLAVFMVAFFLVMIFAVGFADVLYWPLDQALGLSGQPEREMVLRTDGPFNVFTFLLQLGFFGALGLALPFGLYFITGFIAPGLTSNERRVLKPVCAAVLVLFFLGAAFSFFLMLPIYLAFSLKLEQMFNFASLWTPAKYFGLVVWTTLGLGVIFQFPLVLVILQYLDIITAAQLREYRRHAIVVILIIAAFLTPGGDVITLLLTSAPLYALYEGALVVGARLRARKPESDEEEWS